MPLTDSACRAAKAENASKKLSDGGGLYLYVPPTGSKAWRMNYRFGGKQKTLSFGPYPRVTLADARALRENAKRALADGVDPAMIKGKTATGRMTASKPLPASGTPDRSRHGFPPMPSGC
ncbi:MAG: DUF4102 domain-containing protein [Mesorhizobium sp.]|nr:MAG: DUF4102 domain-containing protein [Mesorhizobium sp.]